MSRTACLCHLIIPMLTLASAASRSEQDKPLLSEEIRTVMERDGAEAAQRRYNEIFPAHKDQYTIDMEGLGAIAEARARDRPQPPDDASRAGAASGADAPSVRDVMGEPRSDLQRPGVTPSAGTCTRPRTSRSRRSSSAGGWCT